MAHVFNSWCQKQVWALICIYVHTSSLNKYTVRIRHLWVGAKDRNGIVYSFGEIMFRRWMLSQDALCVTKKLCPYWVYSWPDIPKIGWDPLILSITMTWRYLTVIACEYLWYTRWHCGTVEDYVYWCLSQLNHSVFEVRRELSFAACVLYVDWDEEEINN